MPRKDRGPDQLRNVTLVANFTEHAEGSVLASFGRTRVLCTATAEERVPGHVKGSGRGWVTAEYGMLPRSTHTRTDREAAKGKQSGRTQEIQRLIGRARRAAGADRLRRATGGRRHPDRGDHRRVRGAGDRAPAHAAGKGAPAPGCGGERRDPLGAGAARPGLRGGLRRRGGHERGRERRRRAARGAGHRREAALHTRAAQRDGGDGAEGSRGAAPEAARGHRRGLREVKLLVATSNEGKLVEIRQILAGVPLELVSLRDAGLPAPDETGDTFHDNAAQKATTCARQSGLWTLADDSGLCVDALDGAPGLHSARYAPTDSERRSRLLAALEGVPQPRRGAHFFCA